MEEIQGIEKFLEKLHQLMIVKGMDKLTLMAKESSKVLDISTQELEKLRQLKRDLPNKVGNNKSFQYLQSCSNTKEVSCSY
jgi:hypothetical protein